MMPRMPLVYYTENHCAFNSPPSKGGAGGACKAFHLVKSLWLRCVLLFLLGGLQQTLQGQSLEISTYRPCQVLLIGEEESLSESFGWWTVWCKQDKKMLPLQTQYSFEIEADKRYFVVIYDPRNSRADGVVLKGVVADKKKQKLTYYLDKNSFVDWHNLDCKGHP